MMMTDRTVIAPPVRRDRTTARRALYSLLWLLDHWVLVFLVGFGIYVILPFCAPIFMHAGWTGLAQLVYTVYSTQCHQMAQRSFFLFGPQPMYNIAQLPIPMTNNGAADMLALRAFIGNADLGWKVAWSDRMVYMHTSLWLAGAVFGILHHRRRILPLRLWRFGLLLLPMLADGGTHFLGDVTGGLVGSARYDNGWLAHLTGNVLPTWFYVGDALGSFNSWLRLISGVLLGVAIVWLAFPHMDYSVWEAAKNLHKKLSGSPVADLPV